MKKIALFTLVLTLAIFVSCKGKKEKNDDHMNGDTATTQVQDNASMQMNNMEDNMQDSAAVHNAEVEDDVFGGGTK